MLSATNTRSRGLASAFAFCGGGGSFSGTHATERRIDGGLRGRGPDGDPAELSLARSRLLDIRSEKTRAIPLEDALRRLAWKVELDSRAMRELDRSGSPYRPADSRLPGRPCGAARRRAALAVRVGTRWPPDPPGGESYCRAGGSRAYHPHMLRHSCGFALANRGYDLRLIQDYPRHRDPATPPITCARPPVVSRDHGKARQCADRRATRPFPSRPPPSPCAR